MLITGISMAFMATLCWAISAFPFTKAGRLMSVASMNLFRLLVGTLMIMLVAWISDGAGFTAIFSIKKYEEAWLWLGISGILALGIGDYLNFRMYLILSPRYGTVLMALAPAASLLVGILLINETINLTGIIGMMITIAGVMGMSLGRTERSNIPDHGQGSVFKGILFGTISAMCTGAGLAFSKKGFLMQAEAGNAIHPLTASFIRFISATVVVVIAMMLNKKFFHHIKNILSQRWPVLRIAWAGTIFGPLLAVSFALGSIQYINVAAAQTIFALVPVITLLIAHFIYKEKITRHALAGVAAAIAGVLILIWRIKIQAMMS